ncbi:MAG: UDP-N-acetylglucosamine 2-epimerase (non-hydrolyzing) [bacterium]|nr:UDP-N-acetylglucosamine 2-epimerase (non-hydrolyzing) [bacterium]
MKVATIVGARPQFIKLAPLSQKLRLKGKEVLIHTGQHYDYEMSRVFFDELGIPLPDYHLEVGSDSHAVQTGKMLIKIEEVLVKEKPDVVLVYGDTNSTLAGALVTAKLNIPIGHVEAGLRSFDRTMPEEINRVVSDHLSSFCFAPTQTAVDNLKEEGIENGVYLTGDVMYDAALNAIEIARGKSKILAQLGIKEKEYLLVTLHRAGNTDIFNNLASIVDALGDLNEQVIFPVHPRTRKALADSGLLSKLEDNPHLKIMTPVGYFDFLLLEYQAKKILTDSGGIQKEAYFFKVPCITLRENTEWVETVEDGWNILVGTNKDLIHQAVSGFNPDSHQRDVFGDGKASEKIVEILVDF